MMDQQDDGRCQLRIINPEDPWGRLPDDVRRGLSSQPKTLPCKYFYDRRGSVLFEKICQLPEYYQTRTESELLQAMAPEIVARTRASGIVELGSGTAEKTIILLDAFMDTGQDIRYVPLDISETALREAMSRLSDRYQNLSIEALVCDYTRDLSGLSPPSGSLVLFLGSTIGNFSRKHAQHLLESLSRRLSSGDWLLLGVDLIKSKTVLEKAYNDSQGVTADFNKNILSVINRRLNADFDLDDFEHRAFFDTDKKRIELHLEANRDHEVLISDLDLTVSFFRGETIFTEISQKFSRESAEELLRTSNFSVSEWYVSRNGYYALLLASVE